MRDEDVSACPDYKLMHIEESDSDPGECLLWIPRRKSNQSLFGELINPPVYDNRNLIIDFEAVDLGEQAKLFKPKEKTVKIKKPCDYRKNICGYITKKIIREYVSATYFPLVQKLCMKHGCSYNASKSYFLGRIEHITGPSHVPSLFKAASKQQAPIKQAFKQFFVWFTKERYLRYLLLEGKMEQKDAYIAYKNTILLSLVNQDEQLKLEAEDSLDQQPSACSL